MRTMLIHSRAPIMNLDPGDHVPVMAHCFGPFDTVEEAEAFDLEAPDDCWKIALPITGPDPLDVGLAMAWEAEHHLTHDTGNGAT